MSALGRKVLDLAEQQGLLDGKAILELRKKVAESKFVVTPEAIAKVLVDSGHLTPFQARKLVSQALGNEPDPIEKKAAERSRATAQPRPVEDLALADDDRPTSKSRPAAANEEVVDLELVDEPAAARPHSADLEDLGATIDDYPDVERKSPAPAARGGRWKTDLPPSTLSETIELSPHDVPGAAADLSPIDDLFELDPQPSKPLPPKSLSSKSLKPKLPPPSSDLFAGDPLEPLPLAPLSPAKPRGAAMPLKNVWDSPFLLIGGGLLGVIVVAFALLYYALTRGTAAELFSKAEDEYRGASFTSASALYDQFLQKYPSNDNASLARVRRGMAALRQIADEGNSPRLALETAQQVLPQIEKEEKFSEARPELSSILPAIADGLASRAAQTTDPPRKQEWVKLATEALALVNNPAYLPASLRQDRESQIARIVDKLKSAERGIERDKDLAKAIEAISTTTEKGQTAEAYRLRADLLSAYPALASQAELVAATRKISVKEGTLVKVASGGPAPLTADHPGHSETLVLSSRQPSDPTSGPASGAASAAALLLEGAAYGIDVPSGRLLWRRFVGYQTLLPPLAVSLGTEKYMACLDAHRQELALVESRSGTLKWRQPLSARAAGFVASGNRLLITLQTGQLLSIESASGQIVSSAQLPQPVTVGPAVRQSRVFQLGEHSSLFILDADSLQCVETVYLGHHRGTLLVPPVAVLDALVMIESPADDYSLVQLLALDAKIKKWAAAGQPRRLKGRVTVPPAVSGARVAIATDLGQVAVLHIDAANAEALRLVAGLAATESSPRPTYVEMDRTRLWLAGHRRAMYEIQETLQQLSLKWTENQDDRFVSPPQLHGDALITSRRRAGIDAILLESCNAASGAPSWTTRLASPAIALVPDSAAGTLHALTSSGQLFSLDEKAFTSGQRDQADASSTIQSSLAAALSADGSTLAWSSPKESATAYVVGIKAKAKPASLTFPATPIAPAVPLSGGLLGALVDGRIAYSATPSSEKVNPFLPPLVPDALPLWTQPMPTGPTSFLISDGRGVVYAVGRKDSPQPHLASLGQSATPAPVTALAWTGSAAIGVLRQESSDALIGFDERAAITFQPAPLAGRVTAGPYVVGGLVLLACEPDGLLCVTNEGRIRWQQPLERGPLAGPPLALADGDILLAYQSGAVCRVDPALGQEKARIELQQPLQGPLSLFGPNVVATGSDGALHRLTIPSASR